MSGNGRQGNQAQGRGRWRGVIRKWLSEAGFWSLVDQSAVSAGNFFTAILLARGVAPADYGVYAVLFALMLFMLFLHGATIVYGLSLHGASGTDATLRPLTGGSVALTAVLGTALGMATGAVAILFHRTSLAPWLVLTVLFWQLQETTRRALMSRLRHRDAVWGDALSYLGQAGWIAYLFVGHRLTLAATFQVMAVTSAAGWLLQTAQLKLVARDFSRAMRLLPTFWHVGRWTVLASVAQGFISQALLWFLALFGMTQAASFQSLLNLLRATNPIMFAIGGVLLPTVAIRRGDSGAGLRAARDYGLLGALVLLPYLALIFTFPGAALRLLYGAGSPYVGLRTELRVLVLGSAFAYSEHILGAYYYGRSRSDIVLRCESISACVVVVGGLVLVSRMGVLGAAMTYDLTFAASVAAFCWFLRHDNSHILESSEFAQRLVD